MVSKQGEERMLITRETDYALRILRTLSAGGYFTTGELAGRDRLNL